MALKYRGGPTSDSSIVVGRREARRVAEQCRHDANAALNLSPLTPSSAGRQEVVIGSQSQPQLKDGTIYRQLGPRYYVRSALGIHADQWNGLLRDIPASCPA